MDSIKDGLANKVAIITGSANGIGKVLSVFDVSYLLIVICYFSYFFTGYSN